MTESAGPLSLTVRRVIRAPVESVFAAWTEPAHLRRWWGPKTATCPEAEVDLRVGGRYRLANLFPDGKVVWISGMFEAITPPTEIVYTWQIEPAAGAAERVTVRFERHGDSTEVTVQHQRIADAATRAGHEAGWSGCFDKLADHLERS